MPQPSPQPAAKIHPASREMLPDDPLEMQAFEVPGDPALMLRLIVEDYARLGAGVEAINDLACDPNYQALFGLWRLYGADEFRRRVEETVAKCGVMRVTVTQTVPLSDRLVEIQVPHS